MQWPNELLTVIAQGMEVEPAKGLSQEEVVCSLLNDTARRAVWRADGKPEFLGDSLRWPYSPLGSVVAERLQDRARRLSLGGPPWGRAVDAINAYMEENAAAICAAFKDEQEPYDDLMSQR